MKYVCAVANNSNNNWSLVEKHLQYIVACNSYRVVSFRRMKKQKVND